MTDETATITKANLPTPPEPEPNGAGTNNGTSAIFGVSLRGWIALLLVGTLCFLVVRSDGKDQTLLTNFCLLAGGAITFYFGQASKK